MTLPVHNPNWLTVAQAAEKIGRAESTIRQYVAADKLEAVRVPGGNLEISAVSIDRMIQDRREQP